MKLLKKAACVTLTLALLVSTGMTAAAREVVLGDANGDGKVTSRDSLVVRQYIAEYDVAVSDRQAADYNGNGRIDAGDALYIRKTIARFLDETTQEVSDLSPGYDGYELVFADEFNGDALNTDIWDYEIGFIRNNEPQYYTDRPENVSVRDGNLVITCQQEDYKARDGKTAHFTSGSVNTQKGYSFTYGKIEMRAKLPVGECEACWPAFWLLGTQSWWPYGGEIDIVEMYGTNYNRYESNIHWSDPSLSDEYGGHVHFYTPVIHHRIDKELDEPLGNDWHTYGLEWDEQQMVFLFDDEPIGSFDITGSEMTELHAPQYILLNLALTQEGDTTPLYNGEKLEYLIDYVRVYQKQ